MVEFLLAKEGIGVRFPLAAPKKHLGVRCFFCYTKLMNKNYPEIRIKNAWLVYQNASVHLHKLWGKNEKLMTLDEVDKKVNQYEKAWKKYENTIMKGILNLTGLKFKQNIIDVYIAPWFSAFSDPMVIGIKYSPNYFTDVLTHELLHRLLTDNTKVKKTRLLNKWKKSFGSEHSFVTIVHIPVHAIHKAIYLDVLKDPKRMAREKKYMRDHQAIDYLKSWEYVDREDYKTLIKKIKETYKNSP